VTVIGPLLLSLIVAGMASPYLVSAGRRIERNAPPPVARRAVRSRQAAVRGVRSARHATVPRIVATAIAQDWQSRRRPPRGPAQVRPAAKPVRPANASGGAAVTSLGAPRPHPVRSMPPPPEPSKPARRPAERKPDVTVPGTGASADLFAALGVLLGHARSGRIRGKQRALVSVAEALDYMSGQMGSFATSLSEPGQHYPPVVWEQVERAAAHLKAASSCTAEGASAVAALIATTLGEAGDSTPDRSELIGS
jgi:hypothetical protein